MNPGEDLDTINDLTEKIIGCAIDVHRHLGPGLLENTYEKAMCVEMDARGLTYELIVENSVLVELKSVSRYDSVFMAQILTYLRCTGLRVGLLINFNGRVLRTGVRRFTL